MCSQVVRVSGLKSLPELNGTLAEVDPPYPAAFLCKLGNWPSEFGFMGNSWGNGLNITIWMGNQSENYRVFFEILQTVYALINRWITHPIVHIQQLSSTAIMGNDYPVQSHVVTIKVSLTPIKIWINTPFYIAPPGKFTVRPCNSLQFFVEIFQGLFEWV